MPQGLVQDDIVQPGMPTLTIQGPHVPVFSPEPEGSLVRELASSMGGTSSQQSSPVLGMRATQQEEEAGLDVPAGQTGQFDDNEEDRQSEGSQRSEIILNPMAAVERSARERGVRNRRSFRRRRVYQAVMQLHRLSNTAIRRWTRSRGCAVADPKSAVASGPMQVQRVRRLIRHPLETAPPGARRVRSLKKGSHPNN